MKQRTIPLLEWDAILEYASQDAADTLIIRCGAVVCAFHYLETVFHQYAFNGDVRQNTLWERARLAHAAGFFSSDEQHKQLQSVIIERNRLIHGEEELTKSSVISLISKVRELHAQISSKVATKKFFDKLPDDEPDLFAGQTDCAPQSIEATIAGIRDVDAFARDPDFQKLLNEPETQIVWIGIVPSGRGSRVIFVCLPKGLEASCKAAALRIGAGPALALLALQCRKQGRRLAWACQQKWEAEIHDKSLIYTKFGDTHVRFTNSNILSGFSVSGDRFRIYEIAKALNMPNKQLILIARANGIEAMNHMTSISSTDADRLFSIAASAKVPAASLQPTTGIP